MKTSKSVILQGPTLQASAKAKLPETIELCHTGEWKTPWHGDFEITSGDLHEAKAHFDAGHYRADDGRGSLPGTLNHDHGAAAYWIDDVTVEQTSNDPSQQSLVAKVTWTALGKEKIERDEYRYTSFEFNPRGMPLENPEKQGEYWVNVLSGATLTNDPLLKKLKKVMASAKAGSENNNQGESMKLEDIRAKEPDTLTDEEKAFMAEHKADLTDDERTKFELADPADPKDPPAPKDPVDPPADPAPADPADNLEASARPVQITAGQLAKLEADAKAGLEAKAQLDRERTETMVKGLVASTRIKSEQAEEVTGILLASAPALRKRLEGLFASLPQNAVVTAGETGDGGADAKDTKVARLTASAEEHAAKHKVSFGEALRAITNANPELADYREEE